MSLEQSVYEALRDSANLGVHVGDRVFPVTAPGSVPLPYVTFQRISHERIYSAAGVTGLQRARIQVDCWGEPTADGYEQISDAFDDVVSALEAQQGNLGTTNQTWVSSSFLDNSSDEQEPVQDNRQLAPHRRRADFIFMYV